MAQGGDYRHQELRSHLYFYALAVNAKGDKEKSIEIFQYLANYNFAGWENSVVRSLAQAQLKV